VIIRLGKEWAKGETSANAKLRSRTSRREQKLPVRVRKPKWRSVAAIRPPSVSQMLPFVLR
jgi:hypothetical protein